MQKPSFKTLQSHYSSNKKVKKDALFTEIGWKDLINDPAYDNTCAIRVSLALIKAGISIRGRFPIKLGPHKNMMIEPGQKKLSDMLATPAYFGKPEKFPAEIAAQKIGNRQGIIAFMNIPDYNNGRGGHIDLVTPETGGYYTCESDCYWDAKEVWFWELR